MIWRPSPAAAVRVALVIGLFALATGCERAERGGKSASGAGGPGSDGSAGALTVMIEPEKPTASSELRAICSCANDPMAQYRWELNGAVLQGEIGTSLPHLNRFRKGDRVSVTVSAAGSTASAAAVIENSPPAITSVTLQPEVIYRGISITAMPAASDADGDEITYRYQWFINGNELPDDTAVLAGDRFRRGDRISLTVTPADRGGEGPPYTTREIVIPNGPPRFTSTPEIKFRSADYEYQAVAADPDGDPVTYTLASGPSGMSVDPQSGSVRLQIRQEHAGTNIVTLEAQDPSGLKAVQSFTVDLTIP